MGLGNIDQVVTEMAPSITELAVLRGAGKKLGIEAADLPQQPRGDGHVVGGKEGGSLSGFVVEAMHRVEDQLIGLGVGIPGLLRGPSPEQGIGVLADCGFENDQPVRIDVAVIVGEGDELALGCSQSQVACRPGPRIVLSEDRQWKAVPPRLEQRLQGLGSAIVHHDDFEPVAGWIHLEQGVETVGQLIGPAIGGNDDGEGRHGSGEAA